MLTNKNKLSVSANFTPKEYSYAFFCFEMLSGRTLNNYINWSHFELGDYEKVLTPCRISCKWQ